VQTNLPSALTVIGPTPSYSLLVIEEEISVCLLPAGKGVLGPNPPDSGKQIGAGRSKLLGRRLDSNDDRHFQSGGQQARQPVRAAQVQSHLSTARSRSLNKELAGTVIETPASRLPEHDRGRKPMTVSARS
jgi:hypothetical protein